ncbi:MAG: hypothetical protein AB7E52_08210 [Bdellovibrionales bacterium]
MQFSHAINAGFNEAKISLETKEQQERERRANQLKRIGEETASTSQNLKITADAFSKLVTAFLEIKESAVHPWAPRVSIFTVGEECESTSPFFPVLLKSTDNPERLELLETAAIVISEQSWRKDFALILYPQTTRYSLECDVNCLFAPDNHHFVDDGEAYCERRSKLNDARWGQVIRQGTLTDENIEAIVRDVVRTAFEKKLMCSSNLDRPNGLLHNQL